MNVPVQLVWLTAAVLAAGSSASEISYQLSPSMFPQTFPLLCDLLGPSMFEIFHKPFSFVFEKSKSFILTTG